MNQKISFITSAINGAAITLDCLDGLRFSIEQVGLEDAEIILIDDNSQDKDLEEVYRTFKNESKGIDVFSYKFLQRQQYTAAVSFGLSKAQGELICFISNDMIITPNCLNTLILVAESSSEIGLVRSSSNHSDALPQFQVVSPLILRTYDDIWNFSIFVNQYHELSYAEHDLLTGDMFMLKREVIEKIGYFDRRYWGYFADIDFGIRLRKAGFKIVTAQGSWLYHVGGGYIKSQINSEDNKEKKDKKYKVLMEERLKQVAKDYQVFIKKYNLPPQEYNPSLDIHNDCTNLIPQELKNFSLYVEAYQPQEDVVIEV